MYSPDHCFTSFDESIDNYALSEKFTFPFYYEPHPLCLLAAKQLQLHLETQTQWQHDLGSQTIKKLPLEKCLGYCWYKKITVKLAI